ncbi:hypothetical protein KUCAC02_034167, partial [Chaenocephalus aceratus]
QLRVFRKQQTKPKIDLAEFMKYLADHYSCDSPYELGIVIKSVGLPISALSQVSTTGPGAFACGPIWTFSWNGLIQLDWGKSPWSKHTHSHQLSICWLHLERIYCSPAQLHHLLSLYGPASPCRHSWTPSVQDQAAAHQTADILESFDTHHPLVLPDGGYQFEMGGQVTDSAVREQLDKLKEFMSGLSNSKSNQAAATKEQEVQH